MRYHSKGINTPNYTLIEILSEIRRNDNLINQLDAIKLKATQCLGQITRTFPDYTNHDIRHSNRVLEKLDWFIPAPLKEEMNSFEIFFLITAVYLHDIGMADLTDLRTGELTQYEVGSEPYLNYIRDNHHLRSEEFINSHYTGLRIEDQWQAEIIGRICSGHRKLNLSDPTLFDPNKVYNSNIINVPLLSMLLRIVDELDITHERVPENIYKSFPPIDPISKREWERHLNVAGVALHSDDPLTIICEARCQDFRIHQTLKAIESKVNGQLDELPRHLHQYRTHITIPRKFKMKIIPEGYNPDEFIYSLLSGQRQIHSILIKINQKSANAYLGASKVIKDLENPDRFSQAAHSLREVISLISPTISIPQEFKAGNPSGTNSQIEISESSLLTDENNFKIQIMRKWSELNQFLIEVSEHRLDTNETDFIKNLKDLEPILLQFIEEGS